MEIVAIVGDADMWCLDCFGSDTKGRRQLALILAGRQSRHTEDSEGNQYGVVFDTSDDCYDLDSTPDRRGHYRPHACGGCHEYLVPNERDLVLHHGSLGMVDDSGAHYASYNWNDCDVSWPDECECGTSLDDMELPNGMIPDNCPDCGASMIDQTWELCEECNERFTHGWQCLDGGEMYCGDCVRIDD
jgi:hypothetical protein